MSDNSTTPVHDAPALQPIQAAERVEILDVLRGFAILGILFVNIQSFSFPERFGQFQEEFFPGLADQIVQWVVAFVVEAKFYSMFSFLFGVGVAIQAARAAEKGRKFWPLYCRRLLVLLAIGLFHDIFLWNGRILLAYSVLGFLLLPFVKRKPKTLLIWALVLILLPLAVAPVMYTVVMSSRASAQETPAELRATPEDRDDAAERTDPEGSAAAEPREERERLRREQFEEELNRFRSGSYREQVLFRVKMLALAARSIAMFGFYMVGLFLLGMWVWKTDLIRRAEGYLPRIRGIFWWGLGLGVAGNIVNVLVRELASGPPSLGLVMAAAAGFFVGNPALAFCYLAALVLLARRPYWRRVLAVFVPPGRTALSNYLFQAVVCTTLFYSYGLALYARTGPLVNLAIIASLYVAQIMLSAWWLRHFRFGPAEWVWRTLTYGKLQPMRKRGAPTV